MARRARHPLMKPEFDTPESELAYRLWLGVEGPEEAAHMVREYRAEVLAEAAHECWRAGHHGAAALLERMAGRTAPPTG
ncbi:hypothetical protein ACFY2K_42605 [Kitasatospora sp. NPDC001309]|uniref:hypothetical protein n=1 Tax=Kitasatospora sp. NPDC001309 TaxID=3364013 RepID=UPI0036AF9C4C